MSSHAVCLRTYARAHRKACTDDVVCNAILDSSCSRGSCAGSVCTTPHKSHGCSAAMLRHGMHCSECIGRTDMAAERAVSRSTAASRGCPRTRALLASYIIPACSAGRCWLCGASFTARCPRPPGRSGRCSPPLRLPLQAAANDSTTPLLVGGTRVTCRALRLLRHRTRGVQTHSVLGVRSVAATAACVPAPASSSWPRTARPTSQCRPWTLRLCPWARWQRPEYMACLLR